MTIDTVVEMDRLWARVVAIVRRRIEAAGVTVRTDGMPSVVGCR